MTCGAGCAVRVEFLWWWCVECATDAWEVWGGRAPDNKLGAGGAAAVLAGALGKLVNLTSLYLSRT